MQPSVRTELPGPKARHYLDLEHRFEPRSMSEQAPVVWQRAEGVWVEDVDGNTFLDMTSGVLVANIGHSNPELVAVMREQADQAVNCYDFPNTYRPLLAQKLVEITPPNLDKALILTTGSEATEAAIKVARKYTGRSEIVAFHGAFHGRTMGALSLGGKRSGAGNKGFGPYLPGIVHAPFPYEYRCTWCHGGPCSLSCFDYFKEVIECETETNIAAVITETYQGGAGSIIPPVSWMQSLERWCRDNDVLLIIDEVQASFGRTGKLFGFEHYDITPNLLCLGKGISSGLPVSALLGESRIMDSLGPGTMSSTHGGNPFCARTALVNIEIIMRDRLWENAERMGDLLIAGCRDLQRHHPWIGDVRGQGLVLGVELVEPGTKAPDAARAAAVVQEAARRGLLLIAPIGMHGNVLRIAPPLIITKGQVEQALTILAEVCRAVEAPVAVGV
jgi:4-aminobutyrate aminotransferase / (S)-3-amino-2-methylpropionate transaminase / 5-aminovalerate transaminase